MGRLSHFMRLNRRNLSKRYADIILTAFCFLRIYKALCFTLSVREDSRLTPTVAARVIRTGNGGGPDGTTIVRSASITWGI